jgi:hypothetical protein
LQLLHERSADRKLIALPLCDDLNQAHSLRDWYTIRRFLEGQLPEQDPSQKPRLSSTIAARLKSRVRLTLVAATFELESLEGVLKC